MNHRYTDKNDPNGLFANPLAFFIIAQIISPYSFSVCNTKEIYYEQDSTRRAGNGKRRDRRN